MQVQVDPVQRRPGPPRVPDGHPPQPDAGSHNRAAANPATGCRGPPEGAIAEPGIGVLPVVHTPGVRGSVRAGRGTVEDVEDALGAGQAVGAGVEQAGHGPQGRVQLRDQQQDGEGRAQADGAGDQADAEGEATRAVERVAARSRTAPDRNDSRSVPMVVRR